MPNIPLLAVVLLIVLGLCHHSSKANEEQSRAEIAAMKNPPEHAPIDNSVSGSVLALCFLIVIVGVFVAMPH